MIRVAIAVVLLLALPACDYFFAGTPEYPFPESSVTLVSIEGAFLDRLEDWDLSLPVFIHPGGEIEVRGDTLSERRMTQRFLVFAERSRDMTDPYEPSRVSIPVYIHRSAPWSSVQAVLRACADPDVRIPKVWIAVRSSTAPYAVFFVLLLLPPESPESHRAIHLRLALLPPGQPTELPGARRELILRGPTTCEAVLATLSRMVRAGTREVRLICPAPGTDGS